MLRATIALLIAMILPASAQNRDQALIGAAGKGDLAAVERLIREGARLRRATIADARRCSQRPTAIARAWRVS